MNDLTYPAEAMQQATDEIKRLRALLAAEPTEAEVEAAAAAIYAELSGQYGDFKWPSEAARAALKWAAAARR